MKGSGCLSSVCGKCISSRHLSFVVVMKEGRNLTVMEACFVFVSSVGHERSVSITHTRAFQRYLPLFRVSQESERNDMFAHPGP